MKPRYHINRSALASSLLTVAFSFVPNIAFSADPGGLVEAAQQKAYEIVGKDTSRLKFDKGSSSLSSADQSELRTMYNAVKEDARIREIVVAAYADLPYPKDQKSDLPNKSKGLATRRGEEIKKFLTELGAKNVRVVNMAKKATWLERTFDTKEAQLKQGASESPSKVDQDDMFFESLGKHLQTEGGPGNAVVVIRHD
jgi:hypothetical protein